MLSGPRHSFLNFLNICLIAFASTAVEAVAADQASNPPNPQKATAPAAAKDAAAKPETAGKPASSAPIPTGGVVVFVDPATRQIREPDPSEIGTLVTPTNPAPKAPEPGLMQGPGGAVGAKLGADAMTYMVVTTSPDGKLAMDCVTGEQAAKAQVTAAPAPTSTQVKPQATPLPPNSKLPQETKEIQDTRNAKIQH